jgi:hypothetical protein
MHDCRGLVLRVIKATKEDKKLEPSKVEGTILGVPKITYDEALTYPKCLNVSHFMRFMLAPTMCYQLVFPLNPERDFKAIFKRFMQIVLSNILLVYIFFQHIIPVCEQSK